MARRLQVREFDPRSTQWTSTPLRWCGATAIVIAAAATVLHGQRFEPWRPAVNLDPGRHGVNTSFNDGCPIENADGTMLLIASNRPGGFGANDIWASFRANDGAPWGPMFNVGAPVNTAANDFCPTPLTDNRFLFVSSRANSCGGSAANPDIYFARWNLVSGWQDVVPLSCAVNSGFEEFSPSVIETGSVTQLFFSSSRDSHPLHKIYMSVLQPDGSLGVAVPVTELNAPGASDARPNVRSDGLEIVFDSTRGGGPSQIYAATRATLADRWSTPVLLDTAINHPGFAQSRPSLSRDGTRLYFGSTRDNSATDQAGGADIFVATRSGAIAPVSRQ